MRNLFRILLISAACMFAAGAGAEDHKTFGAELEGFDYPYPVKRFDFHAQGTDLHMAYMDVLPANPNGLTVVLLHGRNFCAATWGETIKVLSDAGYRVVAPDQIGFCKSSKPVNYQFSLNALAANTHALLNAAGVPQAIIMGHSLGGMTAMRYALMYPKDVKQLIVVNPIGLENWQEKGVPYIDIDRQLEIEKKTTFDTVKAYERKFYYAGDWKPEYDKWAEMLSGMYNGAGRDVVTKVQARIADMYFTQPVIHEIQNIKVPTVLMIGQLDRTAPGANRAPEDVQKELGNYPVLGKEAAKRIPGAKLIEFSDLGHAPQISSPEEFHEKLLSVLVKD